jgi:hypothetical protein
MDPSPCPLVSDVKVIHETGDEALQAQSRETLTPIVEEPPVGGNEVVGAVTVA